MDTENQEDSKTFFEHFFVLKRYLMICFFSVLSFAIIAHFFYNQIIGVILRPLHGKQLIFLSIIDPIVFIFKIDFFIGFLISLPIISWLGFKFITPAFKKQTKAKIVSFFLSSVSLAIAAVCYTYFLIAPLSIKFLSTISVSGIESLITAQSYVTFLLCLILVSAIIFQIPLIMAMGTMWGFINPYKVEKKRGWVWMGIVLGVGLFVPPDLFSHLVTVVPSIIIFEISLVISKLIYNRNLIKKEDMDMKRIMEMENE